MASTSERSFGSRSAKAGIIRDAISIFPNYAPPRNEESIAEYSALINLSDTVNKAVTINIDNYNAATKARGAAFRTNPISVTKLLAPIAAAVTAQFGKDSREAINVKTAIAKIRDAKPVEATNAAGTVYNISQSEQSYGSLAQAFKNLVATLGNFNGYTSSRAELKLSALNTFADSLNAISQNANLAANSLKDSRALRNQTYADLSDRTVRIKAYVMAEYGNNSAEHKKVKGISV